jgi:DNA-binding MarR family transcriptional regulator
MSKSFLERPRAIKTLEVLLHSRDKGLDEILEEIGGSKSTGMKRIAELLELGLVEKQASPKESRKMLYNLTERGMKIAIECEKLKKMFEGTKICP